MLGLDIEVPINGDTKKSGLINFLTDKNNHFSVKKEKNKIFVKF